MHRADTAGAESTGGGAGGTSGSTATTGSGAPPPGPSAEGWESVYADVVTREP